MASPFDMTEADGLLKQRFAKDAMKNLTYQDNPFFAMVPKDDSIGGENYKIPLRTGNNQGTGSTVSGAQANAYAPIVNAFLVTQAKYYTVAYISGQVIASAKGDLNSFVDAVALEMQDAVQSHTRRLAGQLYRDGTGGLGVISGSVTSGVVNLVDPEDITQIEVGMSLQARQVGGSLESGVGYVISVDREAGTFTVASSGQGGSAATPTGWSDGDTVLIRGTNNAVLTGLDGWIPDTVSGSDSFFSVNRSQDRTRLAGIVYDGTAQTIQQAIINGMALVGREGGAPDTAFCSYDTWAALVNELGSKVQYTNPGSGTNGGIPFRGIEIFSPRGVVRVIPDNNCPSGVVYLLKMNTWKLVSAGGSPMIDSFGQGMWLRDANDDAYELRVKIYGNLTCTAPGWNGKVLVTV